MDPLLNNKINVAPCLNRQFKITNIVALSLAILFLSGCSIFQELPITDKTQTNLATVVNLSTKAQSPFKQVNAHFYSSQPRQLIFRVISDLSKTTQWFDNLESIETLQTYSNTHFLVRSVITGPWPFKSRELITCVNTNYSTTTTQIKIHSCSDKVKLDSNFVRISQAKSSWLLEEIDGLVKVSYKAWINPAGNVPISLFNQQLASSSQKSLYKLRKLIAKADVENYSY